MMRFVASHVLLACALLAACKESEPGTQVMVVIDAEPSVRSKVFDIDVVVKSGQGATDTWSTRYEMRLTQGGGEVPWPLELALVPRDGDISRNYSVEATAHGEGDKMLAVVRAISGYVEGKSLSLPLVFDERCLARIEACDAPLTCRAGHCVSPFVEPSKLLPFVPGLRPGGDSSAAGEGESGGEGGDGAGGAGESGAGGDVTAGTRSDGAVDECPDETEPCEPDPMIVCDDERCAGCPENFLRIDDDTCAPLLIGLGLSKGSLAPALSTEDVAYDISVPLLTNAIAFMPSVPDGVTIEINGEELAGGEHTFMARDLPIGESTYVMALRAPGHDGRTYTFKVTRSGGQRTFLKAHNTGAGDNFGHAVALQGDTIVIGAPLEDSSSKDRDNDNNLRRDSGAAYVMVREGLSYRQAAYLKAEPILMNGRLGTAIAIEGDRIAIGAPDEADGGSVYVYRREDGAWVFEQRLTVTRAQNERRFGASVALEGDTLAVGASGDDAFSDTGGAVYVYTRSGTSWTLSAGPVGPDVVAPLIYVGSSVALQGDLLFTGATGESNDVVPRGAVYVFERVGDDYVERQRIEEPDAGELDFYGEGLAIEGDTLVVGAFGASTADAGTGSVYVYRPTSEGWVLSQRIGASNPSMNAWLGMRVALLGDIIVTGAAYEDSGAGGINADLAAVGAQTDSGSGYVFKRSGSTWSQLARIKAEPPEAKDGYGFSVAAEGDTMVFGAPFESGSATGVDGDALVNGAEGSGAVYVVR